LKFTEKAIQKLNSELDEIEEFCEEKFNSVEHLFKNIKNDLTNELET